MLTNEQMKAGRYLRWHNARRKVAFIRANLTAGRTVYVSTHLKSWKFTPKWAADVDVMFRANRNGAWMARGKNWDCIDGCKISAF